jgi:isopentenyl-diphosphate Delta-isomerase
MSKEEVVLVDEFDNAVGVMEKLEAHQKGLLHRAFSIFIFNSAGKMLLQRRALSKYHSAGLWTNACCSHPRPNESTLDAANRRLKEEMGLVLELTYKTQFIYSTKFDNALIENEVDHVFVGITDIDPIINVEEVESYIWMTTADIKDQLGINPELFTTWFKIAMERVF